MSFAYLTLFVIFGGLLYTILNKKIKVDFLEFLSAGTVYAIIIVTIPNQLSKDIFNFDLDFILKINLIVFISIIIFGFQYRFPQIVIDKNTFQVLFFTLLSVTLCIPIIINHFTYNPEIQENYFSYESDILQFAGISDSLINFGIFDNQILPGTKVSYYWLIFSHIGITSHLTNVDSIILHSNYYPYILLIIFILTFIRYIKEFKKDLKFIIINLISLFVGGIISSSNQSNLLNLISISNIFGLIILLNILLVIKEYLSNPSKLQFINFILLVIGLNLAKTPMIIPLLLSLNFIFLSKTIQLRYLNRHMLALCLSSNSTFLLFYFLIFRSATLSNALHFGNGFAEPFFNSPFYHFSIDNLLISALMFFVGVFLILMKLPGLFLINSYLCSKSLIFSIIIFNFISGIVMTGLLYHAGGGNMHFFLSSMVPIIPLSSRLISDKLSFEYFNRQFILLFILFFSIFLIWLIYLRNYFSFFYQTYLEFSNFTALTQLGIKFLFPLSIFLIIYIVLKQNIVKVVIHLFVLGTFIGLFHQLKIESLSLNFLANKYNWYANNSKLDYYNSANGITANHEKSFEWIQKNTSKNSVFITNRFCERKLSPPKISPPYCQGDTFVLSAFSKRKVYIEGYRAESNTLDQKTSIVSNRVGISLESIERPTENSISDLKNNGIDWIFIDKAFPYNDNVKVFGDIRFENNSVIIINLY